MFIENKKMFKENKKITECIRKHNLTPQQVDRVPIVFKNHSEFKQKDTVFFSMPDITKQTHLAVFDLDWTLAYGEKHLYPKEPEDIYVLPNRREMLIKILKKGYNLIIMTNQFAKSKKEKERKVLRLKTFMEKIQLPVFVFIATEKDKFRKPEIGMWELLKTLWGNIPITTVIFTGDALGRKQDFSNSDKEFGERIGAIIYSPEDVFPRTSDIQFSSKKEMVIFVGAPGTGKTQYYLTHLKNHIHISQDLLKTKKKVQEELEKAVKTGNSIVIDATNPLQEDREEYYKLATAYKYKIKVLYFVKDGYGWNKLREKPVPTMVYHMYFKKLTPPTKENTPGEVYYIN